jgi:serine/threonine-protein kinase RsbW
MIDDAPAADVHLSLPARAENVAVVRQALAGLADALAVHVPAAADMKIAVTEACTNVVLHAYGGDAGPLEVTMDVGVGGLTIAVRDHGPGFKPLPAEHDAAPLGFGLALIASLADAFAIQGGSSGTEVRMTFGLGPRRPEAPPDPNPRRRHAPVPPDDQAIRVRVPVGPLVGPVLGRVVSLLAARVDFSIDRLSDAQIVSDALAQHAGAHAVDGVVGVRIDEADRELDLYVGPLERGGGEAVMAASQLPGLGRLLEQLASDFGVERAAAEGAGEMLRLRLAETG